LLNVSGYNDFTIEGIFMANFKALSVIISAAMAASAISPVA
jgi:hypothetical protein